MGAASQLCLALAVFIGRSVLYSVDRSGIIVIVASSPFAFTRVSDVHGIIVGVRVHGIMVVVHGIIVVHPSRLHGDCRRVCRTSH
jgi:hypothetical protein